MENNPTNTNAKITLDAIFFQPLYKKQVVHEFIHLQSFLVITGYNVKDFTATDLVIKSVEAMAYE